MGKVFRAKAILLPTQKRTFGDAVIGPLLTKYEDIIQKLSEVAYLKSMHEVSQRSNVDLQTPLSRLTLSLKMLILRRMNSRMQIDKET